MKKPWYTLTEHVDIETGELLTKSEVERGYYIKVGKDSRNDFKESHNNKIITYHYEKSRQQRIQF